jgi:hypothetical protein
VQREQSESDDGLRGFAWRAPPLEKSEPELVLAFRKQPPDIFPVLENDDRGHQAREALEIKCAPESRHE